MLNPQCLLCLVFTFSCLFFIWVSNSRLRDDCLTEAVASGPCCTPPIFLLVRRQPAADINTNTQVHKYTYTQMHDHTNTQMHKYTNAQIHKCRELYRMGGAMLRLRPGEPWCDKCVTLYAGSALGKCDRSVGIAFRGVEPFVYLCISCLCICVLFAYLCIWQVEIAFRHGEPSHQVAL